MKSWILNFLETAGPLQACNRTALTLRLPTVYVAGWASVPFWTGAENLVPTEIRSPDRPARSESLYRLSYRGPSD